MKETDVTGKAIELLEIIKPHLDKVNTNKLNSEYLVDYLFGLSKHIAVIVDEDPEQVYDETKQYIGDTIDNLKYFITITDDEKKKELYEVALHGFEDLQKDIKDNNL